MINRRNLLGGITSSLFMPKNLFSKEAVALKPTAFSVGFVEPLKMTARFDGVVQPKLPPYSVFTKKAIELIDNSQDTSIVFNDFGVQIYVDPCGIVEKEDKSA